MSNIKTSTPANQKSVIDLEQVREIARVRCFALVAEQMEKDAARQEGFEEGFEEGFVEGFVVGFAAGFEEGRKEFYEKFRRAMKSQGKTDEEIEALLKLIENS